VTDRITGCILLVFALWFGYTAWNLPTAMFSDSVGARTFPLGVAALLAPLAVILIVRPGPVSGRLPARRVGPALAVSLAALVAYAYMIRPFGFIAATIIAFQVLALMFGAPFWKGLLSSVITTLVLYVLFGTLLDLYLPPGDLLRAWFP